MGRHSAPDDADDVVATDDASAIAVAEPDSDAAPRGRHAAAEEPAGAVPTAPLPAMPATPALPAPAPPPPAAAPPARAQRSTGSDFALVRSHGDVRARVIAGVVVPFAAYTVAMAVLGRLDLSYLTWIWIPLISAGVLVGLFLDLGHKRYPSGSDQSG